MLRAVVGAAARPATKRATGVALRALARHKVTVLTEEEQFAAATAGEPLAVVYFTAAWCGPCKMISPVFEAVAEEYPQATFLKVDVDDQPDVAAAARVAAMPTFQFFKKGELLDTIVGADPQKLSDLTKAHA